MSNTTDPTDLNQLVEQTRLHVARSASSSLTLLLWHVGEQARQIAKTQDLAPWAKSLQHSHGTSFNLRNLQRMVQFAEQFPDLAQVEELSQKLHWGHFIELLAIKNLQERAYYIELCCIEHWSVRTLREHIRQQLYLRTATDKRPESLIQSAFNHADERITADMIFHNPYMLDFFGMPLNYSNRDLEANILQNMERFILDIDRGFTFVARKKRITLGTEDYYLDLLLYHRHLHRLVAVMLRLEPFAPAHKGEMEMYLHWLNKFERSASEQAPLGLILCANTHADTVELMELGSANIRIAEYNPHLPDENTIQAQLRRALTLARELAVSGELLRS